MGGAGRRGGFREESMGVGRGVSWIPIFTSFFMLSVKSKCGESGLSGESGGLWLVGVRGDEC